MRVLVTGGAGFIGSHVVEAYLEQGHEVVVLDDLSSGSLEYDRGRVECETVDVSDEGEVSRVFESFRPEIVNHHAAQIDPRFSVEDPLHDERINVGGTLNLLRASVETGARAFVFASSGGAVYGEQVQPADETTPKAPLSPYGAAKLAAETYLFVFRQTLGLKAVSLRYSNVYGPRQEGGVIPIFIRRMLAGEEIHIFGDGEQTRDFIHASDAARANVLATEHLLSGRLDGTSIDDLAFNISAGTAISMNDLYTRVAHETGYSLPAVHEGAKAGDIRDSVLSSAKAERVLGFRPAVPLDEGLRATIEWLSERT